MISIGIDVSKGKSTVCIMKPGGEVLSAPFEVVHTKTELLNLVRIIKSQNEEVRVVMEDTGHYHLSVATLLVDNGIFVCSVNALRMKKYCSQSIRRAKMIKLIPYILLLTVLHIGMSFCLFLVLMIHTKNYNYWQDNIISQLLYLLKLKLISAIC